MKILKVIVDEMPWTCSECKFLVDKLPYYCCILDRFVKEDIVFEGKPDWCPLVAGKIIPTIRKGYLLIKESEDK